VSRDRLQYITKKHKIRGFMDNNDAIPGSDVIIIAVKPKDVADLLVHVSGTVKKTQLVISVAAGITTRYIERYLNNVPVIRAMPNIAMTVQEGMTAVCKGTHATKKHVITAKKVFEPVSKVTVQKESLFNQVTAISGSGPAYVFYFSEALTEAAISIGFDKQSAKLLVNQTIAGSSKMLSSLADEPETLRRKVTSPGGTTEQAINSFDKNCLKKIIADAVMKARQRAEELTK
jgi:pyrroline-5-carboxylate reductase